MDKAKRTQVCEKRKRQLWTEIRWACAQITPLVAQLRQQLQQCCTKSWPERRKDLGVESYQFGEKCLFLPSID
jgi:hypothetical protein